MNGMVQNFKRLCESGRVDNKGLKRAVMKNLITKEQYKEITGKNYRA